MFNRFEQPKLDPKLERDPKNLAYSDKLDLADSLQKHKDDLINKIAYYEQLLDDPQVKRDEKLIQIHTAAQTALQEELIRTNKLLARAINPEI